MCTQAKCKSLCIKCNTNTQVTNSAHKNVRVDSIHWYTTNDEYRKKTQRPITEKKKLKVFDHQIHQNLATDVIGVSFDAQ